MSIIWAADHFAQAEQRLERKRLKADEAILRVLLVMATLAYGASAAVLRWGM